MTNTSAIPDLLLVASQSLKIDLHNTTRNLEYIEGRAIVYSIMRDCLNMTYDEIGKVFNKNHGTILHAVKALPYMIKYKPSLEEKKMDILQKWGELHANASYESREDRIKNLQERIFLLNLENTHLNKQLTTLKNERRSLQVRN